MEELVVLGAKGEVKPKIGSLDQKNLRNRKLQSINENESSGNFATRSDLPSVLRLRQNTIPPQWRLESGFNAAWHAERCSGSRFALLA